MNSFEREIYTSTYGAAFVANPSAAAANTLATRAVNLFRVGMKADWLPVAEGNVTLPETAEEGGGDGD